ncbi:hypothetical protein ColLi_09090 [Colletotrichum liriopes]|uniref:Uncharacterized protein n=1 Tax=Colletotrichum liriopes TaxID=708192 RepID=A0AA37GTJ9_9PEZI|nr:hypothetical protein ColLi_09090 [Colletotrichum liriopes]
MAAAIRRRVVYLVACGLRPAELFQTVWAAVVSGGVFLEELDEMSDLKGLKEVKEKGVKEEEA